MISETEQADGFPEGRRERSRDPKAQEPQRAVRGASTSVREREPPPASGGPRVSVVIPVFNEEANIPELYRRLREVLDTVEGGIELIFVDDGSRDGSVTLLRGLAARDPQILVVELLRNFGQHAAVFAGFEQARGTVIVTLDADLQNPPEEIPKLLTALEEGHDVAAGWRQQREDSFLRTWPSWVVNRVISRTTGVALHDYGCMLRAYRREVVDGMRQCREISSFIPALANQFARSVTEVKVAHDARHAGPSKYNLLRLLKLNFDLITGFSLLPIQLTSVAGVVIALLGVLFGVALFIRRLVVGPEVEGVFTLFAILFVFAGIQLLALGLIGEYVGRIYAEVRGRPRYLVRALHSHDEGRPMSDERL